ncbi:uncharacterized protein si:ch211-286o17.1 [Triplophysa rosa]|uniref:Hematopoietic progenitor cell antigen CD34 n=1 Tax=Triplophysa rosa TaxID=992332 RepID=A0A9W7WTR6_TRIRA|nr:uncharacterized protein si:ch211-286o17.1 [Triplophysa rosa]KAI7808161.1 hypothetical protein IRJ41_019910 [Triplophysa rosa]
MLQDQADLNKHTLRMATLTMKKCHKMLSGAFVICVFAVLFQGVICEVIKDEYDVNPVIRGDGDPTAIKDGKDNVQVQIVEYPTISFGPESSETPAVTQPTEPTTDQQSTKTPDQTDSHPPKKSSITSKGNVVCVDEIPVRYRYDVLLKLKAPSTCEDTKDKIQSVLEHLCGEDCKLEIFQKDNTDEIIVYGESIEANPEEMAVKFNIDNIMDKVEVEKAVSRQRSKAVFISVLIAGLLLAALLIAGYLLKSRQEQTKGLRLAEESFQVDQENQGNTLLSVAPLPPQEPLDKPVINGESPESPPTNGHSATQTQVADTPM